MPTPPDTQGPDPSSLHDDIRRSLLDAAAVTFSSSAELVATLGEQATQSRAMGVLGGIPLQSVALAASVINNTADTGGDLSQGLYNTAEELATRSAIEATAFTAGRSFGMSPLGPWVAGAEFAADLGSIARPFTDRLAEGIRKDRELLFTQPPPCVPFADDLYEAQYEGEAWARLPGHVADFRDRVHHDVANAVKHSAWNLGQHLADADTLEDRIAGLPDLRPVSPPVCSPAQRQNYSFFSGKHSRQHAEDLEVYSGEKENPFGTISSIDSSPALKMQKLTTLPSLSKDISTQDSNPFTLFGAPLSGNFSNEDCFSNSEPSFGATLDPQGVSAQMTVPFGGDSMKLDPVVSPAIAAATTGIGASAGGTAAAVTAGVAAGLAVIVAAVEGPRAIHARHKHPYRKPSLLSGEELLAALESRGATNVTDSETLDMMQALKTTEQEIKNAKERIARVDEKTSSGAGRFASWAVGLLPGVHVTTRTEAETLLQQYTAQYSQIEQALSQKLETQGLMHHEQDEERNDEEFPYSSTAAFGR